MRKLSRLMFPLAIAASSAASAADLDYRTPPYAAALPPAVVERERIVERRYYVEPAPVYAETRIYAEPRVVIAPRVVPAPRIYYDAPIRAPHWRRTWYPRPHYAERYHPGYRW